MSRFGSSGAALRRWGSERPLGADSRRRWTVVGWIVGLLAACTWFAPIAVHGADLDACRKLFVQGEYDECIAAASKAIAAREYGEAWPALKARAELFTGRTADAAATLTTSLERYTWSLNLRLLAHHAARCAGRNEQAEKSLREIDELGRRAPWRYTDVDDLMALGEAALILGADPREVLDRFYERAKKQSPSRREPYLAIGHLALDKGDGELAAEIFEDAAKRFPEDPDVRFGLARAFAESQPLRATAELNKALELNPRLVPALLMRVDQAIDAEAYDEAERLLLRIENTNPHESDGWALRAVLAHLKNDPRGEAACRDAGGAAANPGVDHLIGLKLSQKYRFAEGAASQRKALAIDPGFLPAKIQLAQDLLRLGEEDEAWKLAAEAHDADGYHVETYNLVELKERIAKFKSIGTDEFLIRMDAKEADVYGGQVLRLLERSKRTLCEKYGLDLRHRITVEIFPDENDFAVRTFGLPAGSGYLGVCFGRVITMNSPVSQKERPTNWESVLWHEFCHVVTLEATQNRMPRWLSEGISVYEELQENPTWGQRMTPVYRKLILDGGLTPIRELSGAFLSPKSPLHLQFAYYESSLAVEFLIERHGLDALKAILLDLKAGLPINEALDRRTDGLDRLEKEFAEFVERRVEQLAPDADWETPDLDALLNTDNDALAAFVADHPNNVRALHALAESLIEARDFERAKAPLQKLIALDPNQCGGDSAYEMLAGVHRQLQETDEERTILRRYTAIDASALPVYLRLIELETAANHPSEVVAQAKRALAVQPMLPQVHRALCESAEKTGEMDLAIDAWQALLTLDAVPASQAHYRLARLLHAKNDPQAKHHVLRALEDAPRFRAAQRLLLEMQPR